jgi:predicted SAM-dependent methyltransferase
VIRLARSSARRVLEFTNRPIAQARFARAVRTTPGPFRINIGSGRHSLPGWLNADIDFRARHYLDATHPWPLPPGSVELIYADNVIEHVPMPLARAMLANAFNALMPGGILRLATPDVERTARAYLDNPELSARHLQRHRDHGYQVYYPVDLLRITFTTSGHERGYLWDYASLAAELSAAGYTQIMRCECNESPHPALRNIETRATETEVATTLVIEAQKPPA